MKKKFAVLGTAFMLAAVVTACGGKDTGTETTVPVVTETPAQTETPARTETPDQTTETPDQTTAAGEAGETAGKTADEASVSPAGEPSQENASLSQDEIKTFAKKVQAAVADQDLGALADLCSFPVYLSMSQDGGEDIVSRDDFMKLKADQIFTDAMMKEIAGTDVDSLEQFGAGVIMGGDHSITFNNMNGKAAITSILLSN